MLIEIFEKYSLLCNIRLNIVQYYLKHYQTKMNFLNFLTSGAGIFNFNLQNMSLNNNSNTLLRPTPIITIPNKDTLQNLQKQKEASQTKGNDSNKILETMLTKTQSEYLAHQQQLINQYMHLNIQLLSQKIQNLEQHPQKKQEASSAEMKSNKKKIKKLNVNCGHNDREHYAKGMCNNCYHKNGRTKKPWKCEHEKLYANGLCQNCYINKYNKTKRQKTGTSDLLNFQASESRQFNSQAKIQQAQ